MKAILSACSLLSLSLLAVGCAHTQPVQPAAPVAAAPPAPPVTETVEVTTVTEERLTLEPIHFDFDKTDIHADDRATLNALGEFMDKHPQPGVTVAGYCDERGTV